MGECLVLLLKILASILACRFFTLGFLRVLTKIFLIKWKKRLSGWNVSHLSFARRITIAQSILQALPIYAMQSTDLPAGIKLKIDQACKRFIWSGVVTSQKLSMVSWNNICQPKINGGLGFKSLDGMNKSFLMKVGWGILSSPSSLWSQVLSTKYGVDLSVLLTELPCRNGSHLW